MLVQRRLHQTYRERLFREGPIFLCRLAFCQSVRVVFTQTTSLFARRLGQTFGSPMRLPLGAAHSNCHNVASIHGPPSSYLSPVQWASFWLLPGLLVKPSYCLMLEFALRGLWRPRPHTAVSTLDRMGPSVKLLDAFQEASSKPSITPSRRLSAF